MPEKQGSLDKLRQKTGVIVGHGAGIHPEMKHGFVCVYIVRVDDAWVLCQRKGKGLYDWTKAREGLGAPISGEIFAEHVYKGVGLEIPFWRLQNLMDESFKEQKITFEWIDGDATPWEDIMPDAQEEEALAQEAKWAKEEALVPGAQVRTTRGWVEQDPIPVAGTVGLIVKPSKQLPPNVVCVEFKPPLVVHETQEALPEDHGKYRLYYKFDDLEVAGEQ